MEAERTGRTEPRLESHYEQELAAALAGTLTVTPAIAQAYSPGYGTGKDVNQSLAERMNGTSGVGWSAPASIGRSAATNVESGAKASAGALDYAYAPSPAATPSRRFRPHRN